jgi:curved DNA-binding protein
MDYYTVLGVPRNATPDEIKKAYKKQSMKHHPDRGGKHDEFVKVQQAYEVLSNSDKRNAYDHPHHAQQNHGNPFTGGMGANFEDLFGNFGFQQQRRTPNRDINIENIITLKEVLTGKNIVITYNTQRGPNSVDIQIPAGAKDGDQIRYQGLGEQIDQRFPPGDLNVRLRVKRDSNWRRDGSNLITEKSVNTLDLILGCVIIVHTLDDRDISLTIPEGTNPGTVLNIAGHGLPDMQTGRRGNVHVRIKGVTPKTGNRKLHNQLKDIKDKM